MQHRICHHRYRDPASLAVSDQPTRVPELVPLDSRPQALELATIRAGYACSPLTQLGLPIAQTGRPDALDPQFMLLTVATTAVSHPACMFTTRSYSQDLCSDAALRQLPPGGSFRRSRARCSVGSSCY